MSHHEDPVTAPTRRGAGGTERGFTLIEIMVVVVILGILAALGAPNVILAAHTIDGWVALTFPLLAQSRWRELAYELELPEGAELRGSGDTPALASFHGSGVVDPRMGGMTLGGETRGGLDLVLRVWTDTGPGVAFDLLRERTGWRLWPAVLLWLAASAVLAPVLPRPRA